MDWGLTKKQKLMLVVLIFGTFVTVLNQTVVTPALPPIMAEMSVDAATAQWLTTGFTLVNAIMIPITAFLIDRFSTRVLFIFSMSLFALGSLMCGIAPNFAILLVGRLAQAAGAGILMPMVQTVLMLTFPVERRGTAMGMFGIVIAFAPAIGPTVAGLVIDHYTWRDMFFAIVVLAVIVVLTAPLALEKTNKESQGVTLDKPSVILSTLGFGTLLYGFSVIGSYGISAEALISSAIGVVTLIFFFRRQLKMENPMLQVRVLANRKFLIGTIIGMLVQASLLAAGILIPIYLQSLLGYSATVSGLVILPGAVLMGIMGPIAGRLFDKHGPRALSLVGMVILTISTFVFATLGDSTDVVFLTVLYTVRMFSLSLINMPITTWAMNALDDKLLNHGTSVNNTFRQVSGSLGTAVLVSVSTLVTAGLAAGGTDSIHANITGINAAFFVAGVLCLIGLVLTAMFVKDKPGDRAASDPAGEKKSLVESIMKRDVYTLPTSATVLDAVRLFVEKNISAAPVVSSKGIPTGFISDGDILRHLSKRTKLYVDPVVMIMRAEHDDSGFDEKLDGLMKMKITEISTKGIIGVDIHDDLDEICRVLGDNHLKKAPVLEGGKIVGVINRSDITHYSMKTYLEKME